MVPALALALVLAVVSARAGALAEPALALSVRTHSPVLRWPTQIQAGGVFGYRITVVTTAGTGIASDERHATVWDSGWVWQTNTPFPGLAVYAGPPLQPGQAYQWSAEEQQLRLSPNPHPHPPPLGKPFEAGNGTFVAAPDLALPIHEAAAALAAPNTTSLFEGSMQSIQGRVDHETGFVPTSVSGGYGGATSMYVRDSCAMMFALLAARPQGSPNHSVRAVLRFMLSVIQAPPAPWARPLSRAPHVIYVSANHSGARYDHIGLDMIDQVDGTMHVVQLYARYVNKTGDIETATEFYSVVQHILNTYAGQDAAILPPIHGTPAGNPVGEPIARIHLNAIIPPRTEHRFTRACAHCAQVCRTSTKRLDCCLIRVWKVGQLMTITGQLMIFSPTCSQWRRYG